MMANNTTNITTGNQHRLMVPLQEKDIAVLLSSCVTGIIANLFVIYLIATVQRLKTVTNVFVFSICICNIMVSSVLLPMKLFMDDPPCPVYNLAYGFINLITILIYISNLTAVSYDRLLSITQPMLYTLKQPRRRAIFIVIFMWVIPVIYGLLPLFWIFNSSPLHHTIHRVYLTTTLVVFLLGPLLFIIYVYIRVCIEMKRMSKLKMKLMTPTNMNMLKRQKSKGTKLNILRNIQNIFLFHMKDEIDRNSNVNTGRAKSESFNSIDSNRSRSTSCNSWGIPPSYPGSRKVSAQKLTETSTITGEMLPMLPEHQDNNKEALVCLNNSNNSAYNSAPITESYCTSQKLSVSAIDVQIYERVIIATIEEPTSEKVSIANIDDKPIDNNTSARNSTFSNSTNISPLHRKRQSSISRMKHKAQELKLSLAFLIVAITYMFTWLPVVALTFDEVLQRYILPNYLVIISLYAITINALTDPFLYGLLLPNFRKTLKIMFMRLMRNW